ncbi:hypothetical protein JOB18_023647 [Solea senegalensis]|uniref:Uncharacterized protein n=1 Tax=Solea senegalensis TaxID=28829 RepID=A0AAV6QJ39_SOLSE|nr:hypothetical protein JOB18_023647 [Solea senegalensis]
MKKQEAHALASRGTKYHGAHESFTARVDSRSTTTAPCMQRAGTRERRKPREFHASLGHVLCSLGEMNAQMANMIQTLKLEHGATGHLSAKTRADVSEHGFLLLSADGTATRHATVPRGAARLQKHGRMTQGLLPSEDIR